MMFKVSIEDHIRYKAGANILIYLTPFVITYSILLISENSYTQSYIILYHSFDIILVPIMYPQKYIPIPTPINNP